MTRLDELFGAALVVPDAIRPALATAMRARCDGRGYVRYALLDRGSYEVQRDVAAAEPELAALALDAARRATGRTLVVAESRVLRLSPGDYLLAHQEYAPANALQSVGPYLRDVAATSPVRPAVTQ